MENFLLGATCLVLGFILGYMGCEPGFRMSAANAVNILPAEKQILDRSSTAKAVSAMNLRLPTFEVWISHTTLTQSPHLLFALVRVAVARS